jgi:uroporphyrinogen decarboxylase
VKGEERFLRACRRESLDRPPVWFMRQAGRSLPEYRALREKHTFLELMNTPDLAVEVTLQPVRRYGVDGAILFSDILTVAPAMGLELDFAPGPVLPEPVRCAEDVDKLRDLEPADVDYVLETIRILRRELDGKAALIGFAGGPFTVASYLVEGRPGRTPVDLRTWLRADPEAACGLLDKVTRSTIRYLRAQVEAGAQVLQIFDTRAGILAQPEFRAHALSYVQRCVDGVGRSVPIIYFAMETSHLLEASAESGADVVGVDWRVSLLEARRRVGPMVGVQGNLDPAAPFGPPSQVEAETRRVLEEAGPEPGHIFNLGHGVLPHTPIEGLELVARTVQEWKWA